jgi:hypothetical protein
VVRDDSATTPINRNTPLPWPASPPVQAAYDPNNPPTPPVRPPRPVALLDRLFGFG